MKKCLGHISLKIKKKNYVFQNQNQKIHLDFGFKCDDFNMLRSDFIWITNKSNKWLFYIASVHFLCIVVWSKRGTWGLNINESGFIKLHLLCPASSSALGDVMDLPRQRLRNHVGQRFLLTDPPHTQLKHTTMQFCSSAYLRMCSIRVQFSIWRHI